MVSTWPCIPWLYFRCVRVSVIVYRGSRTYRKLNRTGTHICLVNYWYPYAWLYRILTLLLRSWRYTLYASIDYFTCNLLIYGIPAISCGRSPRILNLGNKAGCSWVVDVLFVAVFSVLWLSWSFPLPRPGL